jgi:hypothetical protein
LIFTTQLWQRQYSDETINEEQAQLDESVDDA